jgi:hypothetical protein
MSLFSKQKWFCNICGKEQFSEMPSNKYTGAMLCSMPCIHEFRWRQTLSIMGKEYYSDPKPYQEPK